MPLYTEHIRTAVCDNCGKSHSGDFHHMVDFVNSIRRMNWSVGRDGTVLCYSCSRYHNGNYERRGGRPSKKGW